MSNLTARNKITLESSFANLTGPEMRTMHQVISEQYKVTEQFPTPKRFASRAVGIKRLEKLVEYLNAKLKEEALNKHKADKAAATEKGKAVAKALKPKAPKKKAAKKAPKKAKRTLKKATGTTASCTQIWKKKVTPKLKCTRMQYIKVCESKGLSRWVAVSVWGNMAKENNIKNPTKLANERNK